MLRISQNRQGTGSTRQALGLANKSNDFFSPTIWAGIVYGTGCTFNVGEQHIRRQQYKLHQGQIFAEC
jgi:hypothetical protein